MDAIEQETQEVVAEKLQELCSKKKEIKLDLFKTKRWSSEQNRQIPNKDFHNVIDGLNDPEFFKGFHKVQLNNIYNQPYDLRFNEDARQRNRERVVVGQDIQFTFETSNSIFYEIIVDAKNFNPILIQQLKLNLNNKNWREAQEMLPEAIYHFVNLKEALINVPAILEPLINDEMQSQNDQGKEWLKQDQRKILDAIGVLHDILEEYEKREDLLHPNQIPEERRSDPTVYKRIKHLPLDCLFSDLKNAYEFIEMYLFPINVWEGGSKYYPNDKLHALKPLKEEFSKILEFEDIIEGEQMAKYKIERCMRRFNKLINQKILTAI